MKNSLLDGKNYSRDELIEESQKQRKRFNKDGFIRKYALDTDKYDY